MIVGPADQIPGSPSAGPGLEIFYGSHSPSYYTQAGGRRQMELGRWPTMTVGFRRPGRTLRRPSWQNSRYSYACHCFYISYSFSSNR